MPDSTNDGPFGFSSHDVGRIGRSVKTTEGLPEYSTHKRGRYPIAGGDGLTPYLITGTESAEDDDNPTATNPIAVWRCKAFDPDDGITAQKLAKGDLTRCSPAGDATDVKIWNHLHHNVFVTGDVVWCKRLRGKIEIVNTGASKWWSAETNESISTSGGLVTLWDGGPIVTAFVRQGTLAANTLCVANFDDHDQIFFLTDPDCPG